MRDLDAIREIERLLDRKLFEKPNDPDALRYKKSYARDETGRVVHVGLSGCDIRNTN